MKAIIIGGGIAGTSAALLLARAGVEPVVFEAYPRRDEVGGGFQIAPNGMRVLGALGLADRLIAAGSRSSGMEFRNHRGRPIGLVETHATEPAVNLTRAAVITALRDACEARGIPIHYERRFAGLQPAGADTIVRFEDGTVEGGDVVIGADGVHSRVRRWMHPALALPRDTEMVSIGGFCDPAMPSPGDPDRLVFLVGPRHQFGFSRFGGGWAWWCHAHAATRAERDALLQQPPEALRAAMLERYRGWAEPCERLIRATQVWARTAIYDVPPLPSWHKDRVLLVGDAAHAMSPAGGQGASMALEDATLLGTLVAALPLDRAMVRFEELRRARVEPMVAQAYTNDRRTIAKLGPIARWTRDRLIMPRMAAFIGRTLDDVYAYDARTAT